MIGNRHVWRIAAMVLVVLPSVLAGCAGRGRGDAFQPEVVEPSRVVLYIYREPRWGGGAVQVFINQESMGALRAGQYMAKVGTPGAYLVRVEGESSAAREIRLRPGDAAYLRVVGTSKPTIDEPETDVARRALARTSRVGD